MYLLHSIMVKGHNTKTKILKFLLSNKTKEFTIRAISKNILKDYKVVYLAVNELIKDNIILAKKIGQTIACSINPKSFNAEIFKAELIKQEELMRNKDFYSLQSYFNDIKEPFFILLLFGSYASRKHNKKSDIDLMLISDNEKIEKQVKNKLSLVPLDTDLTNFTTKEFLSMLKTTEFNVGKEAFNNNIILFGIEDYYRLIKNA